MKLVKFPVNPIRLELTEDGVWIIDTPMQGEFRTERIETALDEVKDRAEYMNRLHAHWLYQQLRSQPKEQSEPDEHKTRS
jgi:hypothetical protein